MPDLIPVNTKYYIAETNETLVGDGISHFPEKSKNMDVFITNDYVYRFISGGIYGNGWDINVLKKKKYYQAILHSINGEDCIYGNYIFNDCKQMVKAPEIPRSILMMSCTFKNCEKLIEAPKIPNGVKNLDYTFYGCKSLTQKPEIPQSVLNLTNAFEGCTAMEGILVCHANPAAFKNALRGTKITAVEGSCSEVTKIRLMETK